MDIPITFSFKGKLYSGHFSPVHGAGANVWHLTINNCYYGRLRYSEHARDYVFDGEMAELADYFIQYIETNNPECKHK